MDSLVSSYNRHQRQEAFEVYVTDGLYAMVTNKLTYTSRFIHLVHPELKEKEVTASEAKKKIKNKLRRESQ